VLYSNSATPKLDHLNKAQGRKEGNWFPSFPSLSRHSTVVVGWPAPVPEHRPALQAVTSHGPEANEMGLQVRVPGLSWTTAMAKESSTKLVLPVVLYILKLDGQVARGCLDDFFFEIWLP
jgi:hypothetical protein